MSDKATDEGALIASSLLDGLATGLSTGGKFVEGPTQMGLTIAGAGTSLVASLVRVFGSRAPIVIATMRDALEAKSAADARVAEEALRRFGLTFEVKP